MRVILTFLAAVVISLGLAATFVQCSRKSQGGPQSTAAKDSTAVADSTSAQPAKATAVSLTYEQRQGEVLYSKFCAVCHGTEGKGDGFNAFNLDPHPRDLSDKQYMSAFSRERLYQTIQLGGRGINKSPSMPSWGGRLSKQEIGYLVDYVQSLAGK